MLTWQERSDRTKSGMTQPKLFFFPLPRQVQAIEAVLKGTPRILFGGSRGGGKSQFIRFLHYRQAMAHQGFHSLILRRKYPELEQTHIMRVRKEVPKLGGIYRETNRTIEWPATGSTTRFGHCQTEDDAENYLSAEYDLISFDELVTFPFGMAMRIISSLRSAGRENYTPQVFSGTNPGGPEAWWVKAMYIDRAMDTEDYPDYDAKDYAFIPSKLEDNPYLDAAYEKTLLALPPMLRKAYREGSWDVWPGQFFTEWSRDKHVADWGQDWTPRGCKVYCGIDWGYIRPGCCLWVAVNGEGRMYVFDEYVFKQTVVGDVAAEIRRRSREWGCKPLYVADNQMWGGNDQTGETMSETFARNHVPLVQASKDRIGGWQRTRAWLRDAPDGKPWLQVSPKCAYLIRTLPALMQDSASPEDVDSSGDDHASDSLRYVISARPSPGKSGHSSRIVVPGTWGWVKSQQGRERRGLLAR
jgi:phage terminase large subunit